jgi:ribosomal subunit interface protein
MSFNIHFKDLPHSDKIRSECENHAGQLQEEFPYTSKVQVTVSHDGAEHETHVHLTGKDVDLASSSRARELHETVSEAFDRMRKQLRKHHDKVVFGRRRSHKP